MPRVGLYLGILSTVLQVCLSVLLFLRGMHRRLPFFFAYSLFSIVSQIGSILLYGHYLAYFRFFWSSEALYAILGFLCLYEVFHWVFRNFRGIVWFRFLFHAMGIVMLTVAGVRSF